MQQLKLAWYIFGLWLAYDTFKNEGLWQAFINWINPLTPP